MFVRIYIFFCLKIACDVNKKCFFFHRVERDLNWKVEFLMVNMTHSSNIFWNLSATFLSLIFYFYFILPLFRIVLRRQFLLDCMENRWETLEITI